MLNRYSSLDELKRVTAWILRLFHNVQHRIEQEKLQMASAGPFLREQLTATEIQDAQVSLCKSVQLENYKDEISKLQKGQKLSNSNVLRTLDPFLDENGVLRVGGR